MPGHRGGRVALGVGLCACWLATSALALDERPSVLLVAGDGTLGARIGAELEAQGLRVVRTDPTAQQGSGARDASEATQAELTAVAQRADAAAVVRVSTSGVEVWRLEPATADAPVEALYTELPAGSDAERIVAARVVELLRTDALDLAPPTVTARDTLSEALPEPQPMTRPDAPVSPAATPPLPRALSGALLLDVGVGVSAGTDGLGAAPLLGASAFWQPVPLAAFGLAATLPLSAPQLSAAEGSARVQSWSLAAGTRLYPFGASALEPFIGLGLGVLWFNVEGTRASSTLELTREQLVVAGPHAALGVRWQAVDWLSLTSGVEATYAFAKPVVEFADRQVTTLGRPFLVGSVGIEFRAGSAGSGD